MELRPVAYGYFDQDCFILLGNLFVKENQLVVISAYVDPELNMLLGSYCKGLDRTILSTLDLSKIENLKASLEQFFEGSVFQVVEL